MGKVSRGIKSMGSYLCRLVRAQVRQVMPLMVPNVLAASTAWRRAVATAAGALRSDSESEVPAATARRQAASTLDTVTWRTWARTKRRR